MATFTSGDRTTSLEDLQHNAACAASGLESIGLKAGDSVGLLLRNDLAFFEAAMAAGQVGAYPVPVNWHFALDEAEYLIRDCKAKAVIIHADLFARLQQAIPDGVAVFVVETPPEIASAYHLDPATLKPPPDQQDWAAWREQFSPRPVETREPPGAIIYTGGTTGRPKGVKRPPPTPQQYLATVGAAGYVFGLQGALLAALSGELTPDITTIICGPMYHSAPNAYGVLAQRAGGDVILQPRFDPEELLQLIERHRATHIHMVPTMFVRLLKLPDDVRRRYDLSSLQYVVHAAAPCAPHIKRAMIEWWGPVINEYYGSTETSAVTFCSSEEWLSHPGTVGRPLPNVDLKVLLEDGTESPVGQPGDVYCHLTTGADFTYLGADQKRREAERNGLITVGDIGYLDADGFLYLCDRRNHMVISGGANIYPAEIEAELLKLPGVADCAVFGIPDDEFGEALCAYIQPSPGAPLTAESIRAELATRLAGYKRPKRIEFIDELPREDSGKIFKRKLRDPFWAKTGRTI